MISKVFGCLILMLLFVGVFGANSANADDYFILPNPIFAAYAHPIGEFNVDIWIGVFENGYGPGDVDLTSLTVNGSLVPAGAEILPHDYFGGDALKISVDITEFLPPYGILWDTVIQDYSVSGNYNDETPFLIEGSFTSLGHISGNVNGDNQVNIQDLNFMVNDFFRGGPSPVFLAAGDVDGSCGAPNMRDLNYMVNFIFRGGPTPTHCTD